MNYVKHNASTSPFYAWLLKEGLKPTTAYQYACALHRVLDHRARLDDEALTKALAYRTPHSLEVTRVAWRHYLRYAQETDSPLPYIPGFAVPKVAEAPLSVEPMIPVLESFVAPSAAEQIPPKLLQPITLADLEDYPRRPGHYAYRNPSSGHNRPWDGCYYPIAKEVLERYVVDYLAKCNQPSPLLFPIYPGSDQPISERELIRLITTIRSNRRAK